MSPSLIVAAADAHQPRLGVDRRACRRRRRRAGPCRARPRRRGWSCRRARSGCPGRVHAVNVLGRWSRRGPGSPPRPARRASRRCRRRTPTAPEAAPGRGRQALGDARRAARRDRASGGAAGRAPADRRAATASSSRDQPFVRHVDRDLAAPPWRCACRVRVCSIQSLPCSHGELDVLHVAIMASRAGRRRAPARR